MKKCVLNSLMQQSVADSKLDYHVILEKSKGIVEHFPP